MQVSYEMVSNAHVRQLMGRPSLNFVTLQEDFTPRAVSWFSVLIVASSLLKYHLEVEVEVRQIS